MLSLIWAKHTIHMYGPVGTLYVFRYLLKRNLNLKSIQLPSPSHFSPVTIYDMPAWDLPVHWFGSEDSILNLQTGGAVFPVGPFLVDSSSVSEQTHLLLSPFFCFSNTLCHCPLLPALKASATGTKVCLRLHQFQQTQAWKGCVLSARCTVDQATVRSLPPTALASERRAYSYSEGAQT